MLKLLLDRQKPSDGSPESKQSTQNPLINQLAHQKQSVSLIILKLIDLAINEKYEERELMIVTAALISQYVYPLRIDWAIGCKFQK